MLFLLVSFVFPSLLDGSGAACASCMISKSEAPHPTRSYNNMIITIIVIIILIVFIIIVIIINIIINN